jgi:ribosomal protein S18 acetylase RimI-like enzyme
MNARLRIATAADCADLIELMSEFYAESDYALDSGRAEAAFSELLGDERLGRVWLIECQSEIAGYVVLTLGYSMEYGGRDAFVDDLFVRPAFRGKGLGKMTLAGVRAESERLGVRALHLEVGRDNAGAQALYRQAGFADTARQLLTLRLVERGTGTARTANC